MNPRSIKFFFVAWSGVVLVTGCRKQPGTKEKAKAAASDKQSPEQKQPVEAARDTPVPEKAESPAKQPSEQQPKVADANKADLEKGKANEQAPDTKAPKPGELPKASVSPDKIPYYYTRSITWEDLQDRTLREYSLLRNTIYARAGNPFRKTWLDRHFRAQPWYQPRDQMNPKLLSQIDRKNVERIVDSEQALSKQWLKASLDKLLAKKKQTPEDEIEIRLLSARLGKWAGKEDPNRTPLEDPTLLDKLLDLRNLKEMSRRDLRILRNTIYARRGRPFRSTLVESYFYNMDWYKPKDKFDSSMLTPIDRKNIQIVLSLEHSLGGPIRDADHPEADWAYIA